MDGLEGWSRAIQQLTGVASMHTDELKFIDLQWVPYNMLRNNAEQKKRQVSNLFYTGLSEPNDGIEFAFIPTTNMLEYEKKLMELYGKLKVTDHRVSLCNEVFYTSKIEGADTTIVRTQQIHDGEFIDYNNAFSEYMIKGGFEATKYMNVISNRVDKVTMRKCWEILTYGCRNNEDIMGDQYRTGNVQVGSHVGLNHVLLDEMMTSWIEFYNGNKLKEHPFIKAAFLHYTFEHIHPFCDGNGRMGRLLMNNFLIGKGFEKVKVVSFSRSIEKERSEYDVAFALSDNVYSDCTYFIEYMLIKMLDAFEDCVLD